MTKSDFVKVKHAQKLNYSMLVGWSIMGGILVTAYILEAVKGERTWGYVGVFSAIILIPLLAEWVAYRSKPDSDEFRYYIVAGFWGKKKKSHRKHFKKHGNLVNYIELKREKKSSEENRES